MLVFTQFFKNPLFRQWNELWSPNNRMQVSCFSCTIVYFVILHNILPSRCLTRSFKQLEIWLKELPLETIAFYSPSFVARKINVEQKVAENWAQYCTCFIGMLLNWIMSSLDNYRAWFIIWHGTHVDFVNVLHGYEVPADIKIKLACAQFTAVVVIWPSLWQKKFLHLQKPTVKFFCLQV